MEWWQIFLSVVSGGIIPLIVYFIFLGKYKQKVDALEQLNIIQMGKDIATLIEFKSNAQKFIDSKLFESKSPLSLTEIGLKLVKESGFKDVFEHTKKELAEELLKTKNPKTKYDVQESARSFMDTFSMKEYAPFVSIKTYAFEKGEDYAQILRAGSILLRDYYLSIHPEIKN